MRMRHRTVGLLAVATLVLTGCAAGQDAETQKPEITTDGISVDLNGGQLAVRNVFVTPTAPGADRVPKGGAVRVYMHIVNNSSQPDQLVSVQSLTGGTTTITQRVQPVTAGFNNAPVVIPPRRLVKIGYPDSPEILITNLGVARFVGTYLKLQLAFARAGSVVVDAPIEDEASVAEADEATAT